LAIDDCLKFNPFTWLCSEKAIILNTTFHLAGSVGLQFWDFGGSTMITNNHIRLTEDHQSQKGFLWNSLVSHSLLPTHWKEIQWHQNFQEKITLPET
jgi:hypothetical protein